MAADDTALLGEFCTNLPDLQAYEEPAIQSALDAVLKRLRESSEPPSAVVHGFMHAVGLSGNLRTVDVAAPPSPPPRGSYGCPREVCNRREDRAPGGPLPTCGVYRQSMVFRP
jgi:hypothetical protein